MTHSPNPDDGHLQYLLTAYLFESISEAGRQEVEVHLAACAACRAELEEMRATANQLHVLLRPEASAVTDDASSEADDASASRAGTSAYSFEARRLERVIAEGKARWRAQPRRGRGRTTEAHPRAWRVPRAWKTASAASAAMILLWLLIFRVLPMREMGTAFRSGDELAPGAAPMLLAPPRDADEVRPSQSPAVAGRDGRQARGNMTKLRPQISEPVMSPRLRSIEAIKTTPGDSQNGLVLSAQDFAEGTERLEALAANRRDDAFGSRVSVPQAETGSLYLGEDKNESRVETLTANPFVPPSGVTRGVGSGAAESPRSGAGGGGGHAGVRHDDEAKRTGSLGLLARDPVVTTLGRYGPAKTNPGGSPLQGSFEPSPTFGLTLGEISGHFQEAGTVAGTKDILARTRNGDDFPGVPAAAESFEIYNAADLLNSIKDFPGPSIRSKSLDDVDDSGGADFFDRAADSGPDEATQLDPQGLVDLIKESTGGADVWNKADASIEAHGGSILVTGNEELQRSVNGLLEDLRKGVSPNGARRLLPEGGVAGVGGIRDGLDGAGQKPGPESRVEAAPGTLDQAAPPARGLQFIAPANERYLRAFAYYAALDPSLTPDAFAARPLAIPTPAVGDEGLGRDGFRARYGVNPFVDTDVDHLSTFAMDVDTASYTRARALLRAGQLPPPSTVRVEEFVNAFRPDFVAAPGEAFSVFAEGAPSVFGEGVDLVRITVKARDLLPNERRPAVLTFAVDTSGSMFIEERLAQVQDALASLLAALNPDDRVGIVAYGSQAYLALPHTAARERDRILGTLHSLQPQGSTNVEAGLDLAYRVADEMLTPKAMNRVVLCSDGVATEGERGATQILERVRVFAERGIYLSVVGFGRDRYNDAFLEELADRGNGKYAYVDSADEAQRIFCDDLPAAIDVLARDAKIQVDWNPAVVSHYRLLGYENRDIQDHDFRNDKVDAGEVGPGSTVTALYEIRRRVAGAGALGQVFVRFHDAFTQEVQELDFPLAPGVLATDVEKASDSFRFLACVAEFAELLRDSYWSRDGAYVGIAQELLRLGAEFRQRPEWVELLELVSRAQLLSAQQKLPRQESP